ncbi:C6 transcription factor [Purpureocillium lavendulum]|uniref:C6 transcription factor n=1 Tax=Purpureocillium lavendulum TaxID=1247861 RepID=A0AB34FU23_9HYPO|nr:C6 transcription factor [Purpureocillium lavendulum]
MSLFRQLMSNSKTRSSGGCWTCRVRRKKCAENKPECDTCRALEITCYFQDEKPEWMDGGPKQKEMGEAIKAQVKKQASHRRDRKYLEMLEAGTKSVSLSDDTLTPSTARKDRQDGMSGTSDTDPSPRSHDMGSTPASSNTNGTSPPEAPWHSQLFVREEDPASVPNVDIHFLMIYLDYVFPYLFPHYRPPVLAGGRGWILDVLQSNKSVYHTAISLASSFFAVVLANGEEEHEECTARMVHQLETQLELGLSELRKEMRLLANTKTGLNKEKALVVMQSIIQMLFFEVATSNKDNWKVHLDAAVFLFHQILPNPEQWSETLNSLYSPNWPPPAMGQRRPWSTNQAAFRFFTGTLVYIDVLASVTLGDAPRLHQYQANVIPGCPSEDCTPNPTPIGPLQSEEFVGLPNWLIQVLGDVAALESWKKLQKQSGSLSVSELVSRGQVLADAIKGGLQILEAGYEAQPSRQEISFQLLVSDPVGGDTVPRPSFQVIWLLATLSYLNVVVNGWQPSSPDVRWPVSKATELLSNVPRGSCLRALAWPMCVCGCLSPEEDEPAYRAMGERLGPLKIFGTVKEALEIMEKVWSMRGQLDESWDVSKCLNILGHGVLLI